MTMARFFIHPILLGVVFLFLIACAAEQKVQGLDKDVSVNEIERGSAVWVWDSTKDLIGSSERLEKFFEFCSEPPGGADPIHTIFLYAGWPDYLETQAEPIRELIKKAHSHQIKVHYLDGIPEWALDTHRELARKVIEKIFFFNQNGNTSEKFDGIHFDVEPYLLRQWKNPEVVQSYQDHLVECTELAHKGGLPLGIDIPYFYDERQDKLLEFIYRTVDYVAIMNYKDDSEMMISNITTEMKLADQNKKPTWIGIETQQPIKRFGVTSRETFYEEGYIKMEKELDLVTKEYGHHEWLSGFAYHHLKSYQQLSSNASERGNLPDQPSIICEKIAHEVKIDGLLTEWDHLEKIEIKDNKNVVYTLNGTGWKGPDDLSAAICISWNERAFFVCGEVIDDIQFQQSRGKDIWKGDHLELWLDTELKYDSGRTVANEFTYHFGISAGDFEGIASDVYLWKPKNRENNLYGINWATQKTPKGYSFEIQIPWEFLHVENPSLGYSLRINVDLSDTDNLSREKKTLMSTSPTRVSSDPTTFRTVELVHEIE